MRFKRLFVFAILLIISTMGINTFAQSNPLQPDCALTSELLGGQGFNFSGQGFNFSGQGFNFSGQGFNFSGQGFNFSGQGFNFSGQGFNFSGQDYSDPQVIFAEILANSTNPDWVATLVNNLGIPDGAGYGATKSGVIIVDIGDPTDITSHMYRVKSVFDDLAATLDMTNIVIETIDISNTNINYRVPNIASAIDNKVQAMRAADVHNIVINMSLAFIPCSDPITGFDFDGFVATVAESQNNPGETTHAAITPIFECIVEIPSEHPYDNGDYHYNPTGLFARFAYDSDNTVSITIPHHYYRNQLSGVVHQYKPPLLFESGQHSAVFEVPISHHTVTWKLKGPDGVTRTATAHKDDVRCDAPLEPATEPITPILECVYEGNHGKLVARFGYQNDNNRAVIVYKPHENKFLPYPTFRGQTTHFLPGRRINAFEIEFYGGYLHWFLRGPDGDMNYVTATSELIPCIDDSNVVDLGGYVGRMLNVPQMEVVPTILGYINDTTDDSPLRDLFQNYLNESADPYSEYNTIVVASAGNYRPWADIFGYVPPETPLAPARWPETISVSSSLSLNPSQIWAFSQHGDIMTRGVSYEIDPQFYVAGTSFAAPAVSLMFAQFGTFKDACTNPVIGGRVYPPVRNLNLSNRLTNFMMESTLLPLNCDVPTNTPPDAEDSVVVTPEDESVDITLIASDDDEDELAFTIDTLPVHGSITGIAPNLHYTPNENFNGEDFLYFTVSDGELSDSAVVTIIVTSVNDAPVAVDDYGETDSGTPITLNVLANDSDVDGDTLTVVQLSPAQHGTAVNNEDGTITYTPDPYFDGVETFSYSISDGHGLFALALITIEVSEGSSGGGGACPRGQGYWRNHIEAWSIDPHQPFFNSGKTWLEVLNTPPRGNVYYILAQKYITVALNQANGVSITSVEEAFENTQAWFEDASNTPATARWAHRRTLATWATILGGFEYGHHHGHCH